MAAVAELGMIGMGTDFLQHSPAAAAFLARRQLYDRADAGDGGQGEGLCRYRIG